jgi:hypothetical protein
MNSHSYGVTNISLHDTTPKIHYDIRFTRVYSNQRCFPSLNSLYNLYQSTLSG